VKKTFCLLLIYWISAAVQAGPFQNGGFELPDSLSTGEEQILLPGDSSVAGWTVGGTSGSVSRIKNSVEPWPQAYTGQYVIAFERNRPAGGWIEQTFETTIGKTFQISFFVFPLFFTDQAAYFKVEVFSDTREVIASREVGVGTVSGGEWQRLNNFVSFVASTSSSTLRISKVSNPSASFRFDDIKIESANPEMQLHVYPGISVTGLLCNRI
jgi:hypothetical protein